MTGFPALLNEDRKLLCNKLHMPVSLIFLKGFKLINKAKISQVQVFES